MGVFHILVDDGPRHELVVESAGFEVGEERKVH